MQPGVCWIVASDAQTASAIFQRYLNGSDEQAIQMLDEGLVLRTKEEALAKVRSLVKLRDWHAYEIRHEVREVTA